MVSLFQMSLSGKVLFVSMVLFAGPCRCVAFGAKRVLQLLCLIAPFVAMAFMRGSGSLSYPLANGMILESNLKRVIELDKDKNDKLSRTISPSDLLSQLSIRIDVDSIIKVKSAVLSACWNHVTLLLKNEQSCAYLKRLTTCDL
ncbi:hypothetical protein ROZALSC1DRAFT_22731 [Rozella allomycis CSF55]|uniref:Uncharacterized protein n=1 Tax=Rozella allomycis (strain CSF55) TaxID=988480 RepID=A0A4P9YHC1_ROZAC|nr:hypothetical protein ROZALSC1DRAFT_22731 [Rozella allomycis CSF55]